MEKIILYAVKIVFQYHFRGLKMQKKSENISFIKTKEIKPLVAIFKDYKVLSLCLTKLMLQMLTRISVLKTNWH